MSLTPRTRLVNPRLGTYFGIFASAFTALVMLLLIFEQLGVPQSTLRAVMLLGPLALYVAVGLAARSQTPLDYFASGRRVPAAFAGVMLAISAAGGTLLVAGTGLFFLNGFDAWCLVIGPMAGFVAMTTLIAPYYRKFGAFTVPTYLGRRFDSRFVRLTAAAVLAVPMLLIVAAELQIALYVAGWLTGWPERALAGLIVAAIVAAVVSGGIRSLGWSSTAQAIAALLALLVPAAMVAVAITNLPLPQLSHGPVLRAIGRLEAAQGVPIPVLPLLGFELAGQGLEPLARRFATPFGSIGALSFLFAALTVTAGIAAAPWLLPRVATTPGVYEARKSLGWAALVFGIAMLTVSAIAVFMREIVMDELVGRSATGMPDWFDVLRQMGLAGADGQAPRLPLTSFSFKRDAVLFALPIAAGYPAVFLYLSLAGALAAALAAAGAGISALGSLLAEDVVDGLGSEPAPDRPRLIMARLGLVAAALFGIWFALAVPTDPLKLVLWALTLSGSTAFPVVVLSIWWKRLNSWGASAALSAGFAVATAAILAGEATWLGVNSALAGVFGIPAAFSAALVVARLTPRPGRHVIELVADMRMPGGEAVHDREARMARLKQRQRL